jgi:hypothetical protein
MATDRDNTPAFRAAYLAALLAGDNVGHRPHEIACLVHDMQRAARSAVNYELARCNNYQTEDQQERAEKRLRKTEAAINDRLSACGFPTHRVKLGGDPRGPCASLLIPGLPGDGWGDGFAIY